MAKEPNSPEFGKADLPVPGMKLDDWRQSLARASSSIEGAVGASKAIVSGLVHPGDGSYSSNLEEYLRQTQVEIASLEKNVQRALDESPGLKENAEIAKLNAERDKALAEAALAINKRNTDIFGQWPSDPLADRLLTIGSALLGTGSVEFLVSKPLGYDLFAPILLWSVGLISLCVGIGRIAVFTSERATDFKSRFPTPSSSSHGGQQGTQMARTMHTGELSGNVP
jgi:hypothetical protein